MENMKTTYVTLLGIDEAQQRLEKLSRDAVRALDDFGDKAEFLQSLANYLVNRKN